VQLIRRSFIWKLFGFRLSILVHIPWCLYLDLLVKILVDMSYFLVHHPPETSHVTALGGQVPNITSLPLPALFSREFPPHLISLHFYHLLPRSDLHQHTQKTRKNKAKKRYTATSNGETKGTGTRASSG
jgi:hypothetical protein